MNTQKLNSWLSLAANLGVVVGLLVLVIELQQNTAMMESQIHQGRTEAAQSEQQAVFNSDYIPQILVKVANGEALTAEEIHRYETYFRAFNRNMDNQLWQFHRGFLSQNIPRSVRDAVREVIAGNRLSLDLWEKTKSSYTDEYIGFVDAALADLGEGRR